jgi:chromosome segregation protein
MRLKSVEINGFKSFAQKTNLVFDDSIVAIVGPNGSGKSNVVEAVRFVLGEQSMKSMRGKVGTDLIFKGSKTLPRSSRAAVSIHFNNSDQVFKLPEIGGGKINLNYNPISISREVYPDGLNKYILNGSEVRLKDIHNLLASVNIGSSGHYVISQGEADRILNASAGERREMIEDALGLRIYQYQMREAERKLERTLNNMKEISLLRRENAPHLNFLKKQVEKFEKAKATRVELLPLYQAYLKRESIYLEIEKSNLVKGKSEIQEQLSKLNSDLSELGKDFPLQESLKLEELKKLESKLSEIRKTKSEIERKLGRIEGMIELEGKKKIIKKSSEFVSVPREELEVFLQESNEYLEEAMYMDVLENIAPILGKIKDILNSFARHFKEEKSPRANIQLDELDRTREKILIEMRQIEAEEEKFAKLIEKVRAEVAKGAETARKKERESFNLKVKRQELVSHLELLEMKEENLQGETLSFKNELKEGEVLVGPEILAYRNFSIESNESRVGDKKEREEQIELKRKIERIKIKLEDIGSEGEAEITKEFQEVKERDAFLVREMEDLEKSLGSLKILMTELKQKIETEFKEGIKRINKEFQEFFALMFGGGSGQLAVIDDTKKKAKFSEAELPDASEEAFREEEKFPEPGIEINVSLPHKKVKELHALSGGERSLASIALLFAMSQVNPPPFLVLDETDAALDEANSRKFGDMLEKLSQHSQLVIVTHNRETMSRAKVLYGVTIDRNGTSKLLSVKFDEATAIAN